MGISRGVGAPSCKLAAPRKSLPSRCEDFFAQQWGAPSLFKPVCKLSLLKAVCKLTSPPKPEAIELKAKLSTAGGRKQWEAQVSFTPQGCRLSTNPGGMTFGKGPQLNAPKLAVPLYRG